MEPGMESTQLNVAGLGMGSGVVFERKIGVWFPGGEQMNAGCRQIVGSHSPNECRWPGGSWVNWHVCAMGSVGPE